MEADGLIDGRTHVISPALQSADAPAVCPGPAAGGTHPCSLDKHENSEFSFATKGLTQRADLDDFDDPLNPEIKQAQFALSFLLQ